MEKKVKSLGESIAREIREAIFKYHIYGPGDQLPIEKELVEKMKVSRTAIREGMKLLESEGILEIRRGAGTFVTKDFGLGIDTTGITEEELHRMLLSDWYEARLIYEVQSMPLVAQRATDEELREIEDIHNQTLELIDHNDDAFLELDHEFHTKLTQATHNKVLQQLVDNAKVWEWSYYVTAQQRKDLQVYMRENSRINHSHIVQYLKIRDGEGAALAMRYHLIRAMDDLKK